MDLVTYYTIIILRKLSSFKWRDTFRNNYSNIREASWPSSINIFLDRDTHNKPGRWSCTDKPLSSDFHDGGRGRAMLHIQRLSICSCGYHWIATDLRFYTDTNQFPLVPSFIFIFRFFFFTNSLCHFFLIWEWGNRMRREKKNHEGDKNIDVVRNIVTFSNICNCQF